VQRDCSRAPRHRRYVVLKWPRTRCRRKKRWDNCAARPSAYWKPHRMLSSTLCAERHSEAAFSDSSLNCAYLANH